MRNKMTVLAALIPMLFLGGTANSQDQGTCIPVEFEVECPVVTVPEPGTLILLATGLAAIALARKRKKR